MTILLTLFTIVFGELVPKQIGLAHAERVAMTSSRLIEVLGTIFGPLVTALTWITRRIARLFGADVPADETISSEELRLIIEQGGEQGMLEAEEEQMIHAVIELGEQRVHEVMVPRIAMVTLTADATFERGDRPGHRGRPQPHPGLRGIDRRDHRHLLRQGPAAVLQVRCAGTAAVPLGAAHARVRARVD